MNLHYEIIERDLVDHTIVVRFTTDLLTPEMLEPQLAADGSVLRRSDGKVTRCRGDFNLMVPVPEPDEADLRQLILRSAPIAWLTAREATLDPNVDTSMPTSTALMGVPAVIDAATLAPQPPAVPPSVSRFQARAALADAGLLSQVETLMADAATPLRTKLAWTDAQDFERSSPTVASMAAALGLTDTQLDQLFVTAKGIVA
jgi:hypothetical protein